MKKGIILAALGLALAWQQAPAQTPKKPAAATKPAQKGAAQKPAAKSGAKKPAAAKTELTKLPSGLEYRIYPGQKPHARKAGLGMEISIHFVMKNDAGETVMSTYASGQPLRMPVMPPVFTGDPMEGFAMMSEGDSAVFRVNSDSFFNQNDRPANVKPGSFIKMYVKTLAVFDPNEQLRKDTLAIREYLDKVGLKATKTQSGLYIAMQETGTGKQPVPGNTVSVHYEGKLLNGKMFDSSREKDSPFTFPLGQGRVIPGWDEGIGMLKKGGKAILFIPSALGYGSQDMGAIPPNSVLIFYVELMDVH